MLTKLNSKLQLYTNNQKMCEIKSNLAITGAVDLNTNIDSENIRKIMQHATVVNICTRRP
jgi:hypothetical protein